MNDWVKDIKELMNTFGHLVRVNPTEYTKITEAEATLRYKLIDEEVHELLDALNLDYPLEDIAKEIIDVLVVTIGAAVSMGLPLDELWDIVHKSNMAKADGPTDPDTGKKLKPKGWVDPKEEIKKLLYPLPPTPCPWCKKVPEIGRPAGVLKGRFYNCISKYCPVANWNWIDVKEWEKAAKPTSKNYGTCLACGGDGVRQFEGAPDTKCPDCKGKGRQILTVPTPAVVLLPLSNKKKEDPEEVRRYYIHEVKGAPWMIIRATDHDKVVAGKDAEIKRERKERLYWDHEYHEAVAEFDKAHARVSELEANLSTARETIKKLTDDKWDLTP